MGETNYRNRHSLVLVSLAVLLWPLELSTRVYLRLDYVVLFPHYAAFAFVPLVRLIGFLCEVPFSCFYSVFTPLYLYPSAPSQPWQLPYVAPSSD